MYVLFNTFRGHVISRHRSVEAVAKAKRKFDRAFTNGSYMPTKIMIEVNDNYENVSDEDAELYYRCVNQAW